MSPKQLSKDEEQRIYYALSYIVNHLERQFTTRELARMAALGEQKFKDGFKRLFEGTVGEYIHKVRMETAKFLLTNTNKSIKEIALLSGYSKVRNFSTAYRKYYNKSPKEERHGDCNL
jgi:transcriptional regulator GlxA family with amidase domain